MQQITSFVTLLFCFLLLPVFPATAGWFDDTLVTIDGSEYSAEDFKSWWKFWKEEGEELPETPQPYVEWLLLKEEGARMDLANDPGFIRQERVFLQARGLLILKHREVDSQIDVTEEDIKARYERDYAPRWQVQRLKFTDEEAALAAWQKVRAGELAAAELVELEVAEGGPDSYAKGWMRPKDMDAGWAEIFAATAAGSLVDPEQHNKGTILYYIEDRQGGGEEDLGSFREAISKELWREEEDQLTGQLLRQLEDEYQVQIDTERLAAIDLNAPQGSFSDEPVITTSKENVSEKQFMAVIEKLLNSRPTALMAQKDPELAEEFKLETASNIIAQSITNWASLDRHYEKEEPFKSSYEFNHNHRLVSMAQQRLFRTDATPSDEEIESYYQEHIVRYTVPEQAKLYILAENQAPIDKIWAEVAVGSGFQQVVKEHYGQPVKPIEAPINHLDPEVREVVKKLASGETSPIFEAQGDRVIAHVVERSPARPLSLSQVTDSIRNELKRKKFEEARNSYLDKLKSHSQIEIDEGEWKSIRKELGDA